MKLSRSLRFLGLLIIVNVAYGAEKVEEAPLEEPNLSRESDATGTNEANSNTPTTSTDENTSEDDKKYALGSLCNYCSYCKVGIYICVYFMHSFGNVRLTKASDKPEVLTVIRPRSAEHAPCVGVKLQFETSFCLHIVITPRFISENLAVNRSTLLVYQTSILQFSFRLASR